MINRRLGSTVSHLVLAAAVALLALGSGTATAREGEPAPRELFATASRQGGIDRSAEPTVMRSRYVMLNLELLLEADGTPRDLAAEGNTLTLNLFDGLELRAVLESVEPAYGGGFTWTGKVQDQPLSLVTLAVSDGVMAGAVVSPGRVFAIGYAGDGVHTVSEIDQGAFPPEAEPIPVSIPEREQDAVPAAVADDGSVIDVMVVYTPAARSAAGGTTAMRNLVNLAISETNQSYSYSSIAQRLNLVHVAEVSYIEKYPYNARTDLDRLSYVDGYMDNVHTLRDTYHADEVVLILEYPLSTYPICGMAWLMQTVSASFEGHAFALVNRPCAAGGYYSFGHELGHNMGAQHDGYAVNKYDQGPGAYSYSYGYVNTSKQWRTIMAYNDACADLGFNCWRIPYWSNPSVYYGGVPVGTSSADNHRTLDNTAYTVANFRIGSSPPDAPSGLMATAVPPWQISLSWTDNSSNEDSFRIERSSGGSWSTLATVAANTTSYPDTTVTPGTTYSYRVFSHNAAGDSDPSNTASATLPVLAGPLEYSGYSTDADNGLINCGDTVGLTVMLKNEGNTAVVGIDNAALNIISLPGDISSTGNLISDYPDITVGVSEGNIDAFEFSVHADAEHGHRIDFELAITADNWSGPVEFSLPILCAATADYRVHLPVILKQ